MMKAREDDTKNLRRRTREKEGEICEVEEQKVKQW